MIFSDKTRGIPLTITFNKTKKQTPISTKKSRRDYERKLSLEEITNSPRIYQLYMNVTKMLHSTPLSDR
jgi:hypothetical protein